MAHELTDREYLGIIRGEIVWNPHADRWEKKHFESSHPWWELVGLAHPEAHPDSPVPLPKEPPPPHEALAPHEGPTGLTHDQLIRIQQINDLATRGVITEAERDDEINGITSEGR